MARFVAAVAVLGLLATHLHAAPADKCAAAKLKAASKKTTAKLKCQQKAIAKSRTVNPGCLSRAEARFATDFAKAEVKGGCATTGDADRIEATVDAFVSVLVEGLTGTPGTTTTTTTTTRPPTSPTIGSSSTTTPFSSTTAATGSSTTATTGTGPTATTGSSTSSTTAASGSTTTGTGATTTVTTSSTTTTIAIIIPCGGIEPFCTGQCPTGMTCSGTGTLFSACACR